MQLNLKQPKRIYSRTSKILWALFFSSLIALPLYIYAVRIDMFELFGGLPSLRTLENPQSQLASVIYFADGVEMGKYFRENRNRIYYDDLSSHLINALRATEDIRFEQHSGIDLISLIRVAKGLITFNPAAHPADVGFQRDFRHYDRGGIDGGWA